MKEIIYMVYGTNRLLKKGAILVTDAKDIIEKFPKLKYHKISINEKSVATCYIQEEYLPVYRELQKRSCDINEICRRLSMPIQEINNILFMLELENHIEKLPGGEYQIKNE